MSSLICRLILILVFRLAFTFMLCLALLRVLFLSLLMNLTIAHMVLVTAHVLLMVIVSRVCLVFLLEGPTPTLSRDTWTVHVFPIVVHVPLGQVVRCKGL
jgi:hypothetical protein